MIIPTLTSEERKNKKINNSHGEYLVVSKLESISDERDWIVLRSLRLENHPSKIEGEIDIVIFTLNQGIVLLEVKGSKLKVNDGVWSIFNRGKNSWEKSQDPFNQMKDGSFAFRNESKKRLIN